MRYQTIRLSIPMKGHTLPALLLMPEKRPSAPVPGVLWLHGRRVYDRDGGDGPLYPGAGSGGPVRGGGAGAGVPALPPAPLSGGAGGRLAGA